MEHRSLWREAAYLYPKIARDRFPFLCCGTQDNDKASNFSVETDSQGLKHKIKDDLTSANAGLIVWKTRSAKKAWLIVYRCSKQNLQLALSCRGRPDLRVACHIISHTPRPDGNPQAGSHCRIWFLPQIIKTVPSF